MISFLAKSLLLGAFSTLVTCQQDAGQYVANELPYVEGAATKFWNIQGDDGSDLTLVNLYAVNSSNLEQEKDLIKRAVIVIHGFLNDPENYESPMLTALGDVGIQNENLNADSVAVVAPFFPNQINPRGVIDSDNAGANGLLWSANSWYYGAQSIYPSNTSSVSSFSVVDQMIQYFDNKALFPNMQSIVIAGHSMGSMFVNRYAAIGKQLNTAAALTYYTADPNDYVWFNDQRPLSTADCPTYNDWDTGLDNISANTSYNSALTSQGAAAIQANYNSRTLAYARATRDMGDFPHGCSAYTTGDSRYTRFFAFIKAFPVAACNLSGICNTIDYVVSGHDATTMFTSAAGQQRLFLDGFDGTPKHYDFYYPRLGTNDDPYPDPSQA